MVNCTDNKMVGQIRQMGHVKSYWLLHYGPVRSGQVIVNCANHYIVGMIGKLDCVKSYWLWNFGSVRSVQIMLDCINHDMVGQIENIGSCQITLIMIWFVCQVRSNHYQLLWNSVPIFQQSGVLSWYWSQCSNILPQHHSLMDIQLGGIEQHLVLLPSSNTHYILTSTSQIFLTSNSYTYVSSHIVTLGNVTSTSEESLNVVSSWHFQLKIFLLSQHHLQAQVLQYPNQMSHPWYLHSMLWRDCWYYQW